MAVGKEFKEFALKGNVIDLAVGVVIGAAFGKIVDSLVGDIIMPVFGFVTGGIDFSNHFITLKGAPAATLADAKAAGAVTVNYGVFVNTIVAFIIVAFAIFLVIKRINAFRRKAEEQPVVPTMKPCPECLSEIPLDARRCKFCTTQIAA